MINISHYHHIKTNIILDSFSKSFFHLSNQIDEICFALFLMSQVWLLSLMLHQKLIGFFNVILKISVCNTWFIYIKYYFLYYILTYLFSTILMTLNYQLYLFSHFWQKTIIKIILFFDRQMKTIKKFLNFDEVSQFITWKMLQCRKTLKKIVDLWFEEKITKVMMLENILLRLFIMLMNFFVCCVVDVMQI